jgi:hypothetical protein
VRYWVLCPRSFWYGPFATPSEAESAEIVGGIIVEVSPVTGIRSVD